MDEEKRIITIYAGIDYDESIDKLKQSLKKVDAELVSANEDEYQISIAKSKLEDLCNELDLDIDDLTEEWDTYKPEQEEDESKKEFNDIAAYVGKIDKQLDDFDVNEFIESARQNKKDVSIRVQKDDKAYELYIDFEDKVYIELWRIDCSKEADDVQCNSTMLYSTEFDENDLSAWKAAQAKLEKFFAKKAEQKKQSKHVRHHKVNEDADANAKSPEVESDQHTEDSCKDKYDYDIELAKQIRDEILEGANADLPQNIKHAITSRGGEVESMRIAPMSIYVLWNLKGFTAANRIYLNTIDTDVNLLAEDIAHAILKTSSSANDSSDTFKDLRKQFLAIENEEDEKAAQAIIDEKLASNELAKDEAHTLRMIVAAKDFCLHENKMKSADAMEKQHTVKIHDMNMKDIAQVCDLLDDANIKYKLSNDAMTVFCGPRQWKDLQARFSILQGE